MLYQFIFTPYIEQTFTAHGMLCYWNYAVNASGTVCLLDACHLHSCVYRETAFIVCTHRLRDYLYIPCPIINQAINWRGASLK